MTVPLYGRARPPQTGDASRPHKDETDPVPERVLERARGAFTQRAPREVSPLASKSLVDESSRDGESISSAS